MSGRSIGTGLGFIVGSFFGMGSLGATVGGMIGGAISPDKVQGAKIGDLPVQRSLTGGVQPVVLGTSLVDQCLIMWAGKARVVKEKDQQGKGGGPVVVNEVLYQDYRIRVCRSSLADGSEVQGFPIIFEDGRLVYDTRPTPRISAADSAKWAKNVRFYYGGPDQEPDPTEEADVGVGNASAHRQIASFVKVNQKMTDFGNRIPTYEVVVSKCAIDETDAGFPVHLLVTGTPKSAGAPVFATAKVAAVPEFVGIEQSTGADIEYGTPAYHGGTFCVVQQDQVRFASNVAGNWISGSVDSTYALLRLVGGHAGWMANEAEFLPSHTGYVCPDATPTVFTLASFSGMYSNGIEDASSEINQAKIIFYQDGYYFRNGLGRGLFRAATPTDTYYAVWDQVKMVAAGQDPNGACIIQFVDLCLMDGEWYAVIEWDFREELRRRQVVRSIHGIEDWSELEILVDTPVSGSFHQPAQIVPCNGQLVVYAKGGGVWASANGWVSWIDNGITGNPGGPRKIEYVDSGASGYVFAIDDSDQCVVSTTKGLTWGTPITMPIGGATGIVAGAHVIDPDYLPIPDADGHYIDPVTGATDGPSPGESFLCSTTLAEVVRYICNRGQLTDAELFLDQLEDIPVRGITLQSPGTCKDELEPLRQTHFFDPADFDSKLRFRLRGADDVDLVIDPDDRVFTEDDEEENRIIGQDVEFSRKHLLNYLSLDLDYLRTPAPHERTAIDPSVVGTSEVSINEVFIHEEAMRISAIQHGLLWMGKEGYRKFGLPLEYLELVAASLITMEGRRGRIDGYSIDTNAIWFDPVPYDRARAYDANVVAPVLTPPRDPGTTLRGPTISAVMNLPVLRDSDDRAGIYWAATGPSAGWRGAVLQLSRAGGDFENGPEITSPCTMGVLTAPLASASRYGLDTVNTLSVQLYPGASDLDSATHETIIAGATNAFAILYADGTAEIGQFETATETADRAYDLTNLLRGRKDTVAGAHAEGAIFVLLNDAIRFAGLRADDVGKVLTFRAVSLDTDPAENATQTITMTTIESLREWQPYNVVVESNGSGGYCVEWIGRGRLGTSRTPVQSQWFDGYRVTFTIGTTVHVVDTMEQGVCLDAATMLTVFGEGYGVPIVTVRARSKVATNDDDFDSPDAPAGPINGISNEPVAFTGTFPGGFVGIPYILRNGDNGIVVTGGGFDANAYGSVCPGVCVAGDNALSAGFRAAGIPHTAGTANCDVLIDGTSSVPGYTGSVTIAHPVTIAAKPGFSPVDMTFRPGSGALMVTSTTPWTTWAIDSGYSLHSYGFTSGKCVAEFTVGASTYPVLVGINATKGALTPADSFIGIGVGQPNTAAVVTTGAGVYRVELDCATGNWQVFKNGTSMTSGTLALPGGNQYRMVCTNEYVQAVQVKCNFGIEAWAGTPTATYLGVPMPTIVIPCGFEAPSPRITAIMMTGDGYLNVYRGYKRNTGDQHVALGGLGKSSGQWRVSLGGGQRQGICVGSFDRNDGPLGAAGTANSVGWDGFTLHWYLSGVYGSVPMRMPIGVLVPTFALDADADVLRVCAGETVLHTLTLPAGLTWFPAECDAFPSTTITYNPAGPAGFNDWTLTV